MKFLTSLPVLAILLVPQAGGIGDRFQTSARYGNDCQRWAAWNYNIALDQCRLIDSIPEQQACQAAARAAHQQALEDCGARGGHAD